MGSIPYGNPAGVNQANPALGASSGVRGGIVPYGTSGSTPPPIPGGTTPTSTNPYMLGTVPGGSTQGQQDLMKQWTDIYGKGTGGSMASEYAGMQGTNSAAFQAYLASMNPMWAQQMAQFGQGMGAAGVGPNSTVEALGMSNLLAQQGAQASGVNAQMIMQNQAERLGLLQGTEQASAQEVASSGWDVFGQVLGDVGGLAATFMGMPGGSIGGQMFSHLFGGGHSGGAVPTGIAGGVAPGTWA